MPYRWPHRSAHTEQTPSCFFLLLCRLFHQLTYCVSIDLAGSLPTWLTNAIAPAQGLNAARVRDGLLQLENAKALLNKNKGTLDTMSLYLDIAAGAKQPVNLFTQKGQTVTFEFMTQVMLGLVLLLSPHAVSLYRSLLAWLATFFFRMHAQGYDIGLQVLGVAEEEFATMKRFAPDTLHRHSVTATGGSVRRAALGCVCSAVFLSLF